MRLPSNKNIKNEKNSMNIDKLKEVEISCMNNNTSDIKIDNIIENISTDMKIEFSFLYIYLLTIFCIRSEKIVHKKSKIVIADVVISPIMTV